MAKKIGIVGAGAIGGFFGAKLVAAGYDVFVLARGKNLDVLAAEGLSVYSDTGDVTVKFAAVSDKAEALGQMDAVIFTVKGQDTAKAAEDMWPMIGPETEIISFQNGLSGVERLVELFGEHRVSAGITYIPAVIDAPGQLRHTGKVTRSVFGPYTPRDMTLHGELAAALQAVGLELKALDEPLPAVWEKFVVLTPFHIIGCLTRMSLGQWIVNPEMQELFLQAMLEVCAVGMRKGVAISSNIAQKQVEFCQTQADPGIRASMLEDLERGKPLEIDSTVGWLCTEGKRLGVPTPIHDMCYALLTPYRDGKAAD